MLIDALAKGDIVTYQRAGRWGRGTVRNIMTNDLGHKVIRIETGIGMVSVIPDMGDEIKRRVGRE